MESALAIVATYQATALFTNIALLTVYFRFRSSIRSLALTGSCGLMWGILRFWCFRLLVCRDWYWFFKSVDRVFFAVLIAAISDSINETCDLFCLCKNLTFSCAKLRTQALVPLKQITVHCWSYKQEKLALVWVSVREKQAKV